MFIDITEGKKKIDIGIYRVSSGHESKRKKVAKLQLRKENKKVGKNCVWKVQRFCEMFSSTESNRLLSEGKPLNISLNSDPDFSKC
jgi:hypothetical protein